MKDKTRTVCTPGFHRVRNEITGQYFTSCYLYETIPVSTLCSSCGKELGMVEVEKCKQCLAGLRWCESIS